MSNPLIQTTGRRKEAVARVRLRPGSGIVTVNGRPFEQYFPILTHRVVAIEPLRLTQSADVYDVDATLDGGGVSGQAGALRLGIAPLPAGKHGENERRHEPDERRHEPDKCTTRDPPVRRGQRLSIADLLLSRRLLLLFRPPAQCKARLDVALLPWAEIIVPAAQPVCALG